MGWRQTCMNSACEVEKRSGGYRDSIWIFGKKMFSQKICFISSGARRLRGFAWRSMSAVFLFDQVLAYTECATSEYLTVSQCHSATGQWPGRVKFILDGFGWGKKRTSASITPIRPLPGDSSMKLEQQQDMIANVGEEPVLVFGCWFVMLPHS